MNLVFVHIVGAGNAEFSVPFMNAQEMSKMRQSQTWPNAGAASHVHIIQQIGD